MDLGFLLTSLVIVVTPGTGALYTVAAGLAHGFRASVVAALGCTLGIVPCMLAAITGLAALLQASPVAFETLKFLGVAWLLYLAVGMLRHDGTLTTDRHHRERRSPGAVMLTGILINVLNPKLTIFFFAFLPQFVSAHERRPVLHMAELSGVFMLLTLLVFVGYGRSAATMRDRVISSPRAITWLNRAFAGTFIALAAALALTNA